MEDVDSLRGGGEKGCCTYITYYFFKGPPGIQGLPGASGKLGNPVSIQSGRSGSKQSRFMEDFSTVLHLKIYLFIYFRYKTGWPSSAFGLVGMGLV